MNLSLLVDKVLQRKRCPFCVAPFPILKCVNFNQWQCPACETEFCLDNDGDLEPILDESLMKLYDSSVHFPTSQPVTSLLCASCQQNQKKIISVLNAFDGTARQYAEHVKRIESKYPLCATCNYRVSQRLQQCQEEALHYQRQHAFPSPQGRDWRSKIKLAQQMKGKQLKRKLLKGAFFIPEFVFQIALIAAIFKGPFEPTAKQTIFSFSLAEGKQISLWIPEPGAFAASSCFFLVCFSLLLGQILGAGWNGRGFSSVLIQILAAAMRTVVANFLFDAEASGITKLTATILASAGLAIVVRTGSNNGQVRAQRAQKKLEVIHSTSLDTPSTPNSESSLLFSAVPAAAVANGFARFATDEHKYHSFANQVTGEVKPWPIKPKPGNFKVAPKTPDFASLAASSGNGSSLRMRPSRLVVNDPLEVESLFSSFSLSDSPTVRFHKTLSRSADGKFTESKKSEPASPVKSQVTRRVLPSQFWFLFYNCVLSLALIACRVLVGTHLSLISVVLAANFGLRGFIWPRLSALQQAVVIALSLLRLLHLTFELSQNRTLNIPAPLQLVFDVILILIR